MVSVRNAPLSRETRTPSGSSHPSFCGLIKGTYLCVGLPRTSCLAANRSPVPWDRERAPASEDDPIQSFLCTTISCSSSSVFPCRPFNTHNLAKQWWHSVFEHSNGIWVSCCDAFRMGYVQSFDSTRPNLFLLRLYQAVRGVQYHVPIEQRRHYKTDVTGGVPDFSGSPR